VGSNSYALERESNNAATLESDVWTYGGCVPSVMLGPTFVVPSAVDAGDTVEFDGSATASTLIVPNAGYQWDFGDGTKAIGPSVEHSYAAGGTYNVKLTVTDRGGNTSTITQTIQVLGANGQPVTGGGGSAPPASPTVTAPTSGSGNPLSVHLQLLPQSLKSVLANGIAVRVSSNKAADGVATVWITRKAARRAGIGNGRAATVRIGIGTVASITNGTVTLHLHLSRSVAKKLAHVRHVSMTIRLALVAAGNEQSATDAAASY
jgi:PKD domain